MMRTAALAALAAIAAVTLPACGRAAGPATSSPTSPGASATASQAGSPAGSPTATAGSSPACSTPWGTGAKQGGRSSTVATAVLSARAGQHACFDRLVISLGTGAAPGYGARYVGHLLADPSGMPLPVKGGARLLIVVRGPAGPGYRPLAANLADVSGFTTFRQVRGAGSFERVTSLGLGVRARLAFRVFALTGPNRLVIDVAH